MREYSARMEHMMYTPVTLPVTNEYGYFEIRLESIGGLGANLCGKMLGELGALYLSLNSLSFSSYGSEKRGSPVKSYIRWSPASHPLRINSPVLQPHVLGIFHEGLIGTYPVLDGISADTKIVLNTPLSCDEAAEKYNIPTGTLYCLDALSIAMESRSRINMVMLGAITRACPFIPMDSIETLCKNTIGKKYPALIGANLQGLKMGYEKTAEKRFLTELLPLLSQKKLISGATKTPRSAGSIHAPAARYQMTSPPPAKVIFLSFCRIGASTADSVILPVRIWYFSLHRELIRGKRQWSTRDLITDTAKAVSAVWMSVRLTLW